MGFRTRPYQDMLLDDQGNPLITVNEQPELEQVTAEPMTQEELSRYDGATMNEPVDMEEQDKIIEPETAETKLDLAQPKPVEALQTKAPIAAPKVDETEKMFQDYTTNRSRAEKELSDFEAGLDDRESQRGVMTGVAGAIQAFSEGLAAITGGSAKPVQTGAATLAQISEQQSASEARKAKSLRERILQSRQPLEQKAEEIKFRDIFEERQAKKDLIDPASVKSKQARELANSFLDTYIASVSNRTSEQDLAKLENVRPKLENMSAAQIQEFMKNLQSLKFTESREDIEKTKAEGRVQVEGTKREQKLMDVADKEFSADAKKMNETASGLKRFQTQVDGFRKDIDLALAGDEAAAKRIQQNEGVVAYLVARQNEPKGVFTDNDFRALNQLGRGRTWFEQFQNWTSQGLNATPTKTALSTMKNVLDQLEFIKQDPKDIVKSYQRVYKLSNNPFKQQYADKFDEALGGESTDQSAPANAPANAPAMEFPDVESAKAAKRAGKIKSGDVISINGKQQKVK